MSVTIHWEPCGTKKPHFRGGRSASLEVLKETFGHEIHAKDVGVLRGMAIAANDEFYNEVADVVEKHGDIKFWGEY